MAADTTQIEVSAALAGVRRRARYLADADGPWSSSDVITLAVLIVVWVYMIFSGVLDRSAETVGLFTVVVVGAWQHRRLKTRVDALTKLIADIGRPDDA